MVYGEYLRITQIRQQLPGKQFSDQHHSDDKYAPHSRYENSSREDSYPA